MHSMLQETEVPSTHNFAEEEQKVLRYWKEIDAFKTSLQLSEGRPEYTFYDGPPFATGLPHYGHILAGTIKDTVTRYAHQTGHHVVRRFGWDCHGLPVEYEIDQKLGIKDRNQVLEMGIANYNNECRSIVTRYTKEWEATVTRLGRWIDFENDYKTMNPWFMESVWWVFQQLYEKGLVYRGYKVMPFSTACNTPLSNFEAGLNYKDVKDPAVVVSFPIVTDPEVSLLAWTTTPWTLPSNLALCVNPALEYVKIVDVKSSKKYLLAKERMVQLYPIMATKKWKPEKASTLYQTLETFTGSQLVGLTYVPLFPYFASRTSSFRVVSDSYVTNDSGTGIVHQAPAFGEDDFRVCLANGITMKGEEVPCPVDEAGRFTSQVPDFMGQHVKQADPNIVAMLTEQGRLVQATTYEHSYPFCWRSDTPLIYKAVPSWFVAVESFRDRLLKNNEDTYWVPSFVKEKRFVNWLSDARDWAISRNRFWGTPIPLWANDDFSEIKVIGSVEELQQLSGQTVTDLHREFVDDITIPSSSGNGVLKRVDEVFDCWFESGSMPYAQLHYPFENAERFENGFPADFIAEGLDQTRGWFYTLMVISTAVFDKPAFKNLIVNGLVLAADGKKMSKRLKNYPDPNEVVNKYGADALRLYLINSPVVRAESLKFREDGVLGVVKEVLLPWFNAFRFFLQNTQRWATVNGRRFAPDTHTAQGSTNDVDIWVQAMLMDLVRFFRQEMQAYRLYTVVPRLVSFLEQLTNWYVRLNRNRLKGSNGEEESQTSLCVLYEVLMTMTQLMSPFTPFFTEFLYQHLRQFEPNYGVIEGNVAVDAIGRSDSVHFLMLPDYDPSRLNPEAERRMKALQVCVELGRVAREKRNISLKTPLKKVIVVSTDTQMLGDLEHLKQYLLEELNAWNLETTSDDESWCTLTCVPNGAELGRKLGGRFKELDKEVRSLSHQKISDFIVSGEMMVCGETLTREEVFVNRAFNGDAEIYESAVSEDGSVVCVIDCTQDEELLAQAYSREVANRVQRLRKKAGLQVSDKVEVFFDERAGDVVTKAVANNVQLLYKTLNMVPLPACLRPKHSVTIVSEESAVGPSSVCVYVTRPTVAFDELQLASLVSDERLRRTAKEYVYTMDYAKVIELPSVCVYFGGSSVTLRPNEHYYMTTLELVRHQRDPTYAWTSF